MCTKRFKTKRGLSQHGRLVHPSLRNDARKKGAYQGTSRPLPERFGKTWNKEEINVMLRMEHAFKRDRRIAKRMKEFLPTNSLQQIRDERKETTYNAILGHMSNTAITTDEQAGDSEGGSDKAESCSPLAASPRGDLGSPQSNTYLTKSN
jgi:ribosomal protein L44E